MKSTPVDAVRQRLETHRKFILWGEIVGLLHDLGKLSSQFLDYRLTWHDMERGWEQDPHVRFFCSEVAPGEIPKLRTYIPSSLEGGPANLLPLSIEAAVHGHDSPKHLPGSQCATARVLNAADSVDVAFDRNNPLFCCEQTDRHMTVAEVRNAVRAVSSSNVFGYEVRGAVTPEKLDEARRALYRNLTDLVPLYPQSFASEIRDKIRQAVRKSFEVGLSDTTRPNNDTPLWDHSEGVTSIFKLLLAHAAIYDEAITKFDLVSFAILGFGWDSFRFLCNSQKIRDVQGRKSLLEKIQDRLAQKIECELALGNTIYRDDDGIYFLVPAILSPDSVAKRDDATHKPALRERALAYGAFIDSIARESQAECAEQSAGELQLVQCLIADTRFVTRIVDAIHQVRKRSAAPISGDASPIVKDLDMRWQGKAHEVCGICGKRPVQGDQARDRVKVCHICMQRRQSAPKEVREKKQTVFHGEIKDSNGRLALIIARFGLERWLDGTMVRTLFISPADVLQREVHDLGRTRHFRSREEAVRRSLFDRGPQNFSYQRVVDDIRLVDDIRPCENPKSISASDMEYAKEILFLYDRRVICDKTSGEYRLNDEIIKAANRWQDFLLSAVEEHRDLVSIEDRPWLLPNILCAKTPTPSTILDVWDTTLGFFTGLTELADADPKSGLFPRELKFRNRPLLEVESLPPGLKIGPIYEGNLSTTGQRIQFQLIDQTTRAIELVDGTPEADTQNWKCNSIIAIQEADETALLGDIRIVQKLDPISRFHPYRVIATSPNLFLAIVPASESLRIAEAMYALFRERFAMVLGRLPFSISTLFFKEHTPMFVVLDSARRVVRYLDRLHEAKRQFTVQEALKTSRGIRLSLGETDSDHAPITWEIDDSLEGSVCDYFHPYFLLAESPNDRQLGRKSYFHTIAGHVTHVSEIERNDRLEIYSGVFDYEFLDSSQRRFDLALDVLGRRPHVIYGLEGSCPMIVDRLSSVVNLWKRFKEMASARRASVTQIHDVQALLSSKLREWNLCRAGDPAVADRWLALVEAVVRSEWTNPDDQEVILGAVRSRFFFDSLQLYLQILKEPLIE